MGIKEVEQRISNYLILFEGKALTRKQTIAKIISQLAKARPIIAEEIFADIVKTYPGVNWLYNQEKWQALKERYQGEKK